MAVRVSIDSREIEVVPGPSIFDCAESLGVRVPTSCQKNGKCRECLVEVESGSECLSPPSAEEAHLTGSFRLACRARIASPSGELRCHTLRRGEMRIIDAGLPPRGIDAGAFDPAVTRDGDWVLLDGEPLVRRPGPLLGAAVDVGTTTVVVRIIDLETGRRLATHSFENPQRFGGSDVMARIRYDSDHKGHLLQRILLGYLGHALEECVGDPSSIYEMVVAGNTTMRDLFFGLSVYSIGQRPYRSLVEEEVLAGRRSTTAVSVEARELRLSMCPRGRVYGLPLVSGHVGADASACILAIDLAHEEGTVALMDIGTNTELVVGNRRRALAASCPAGPAFEGGKITHGMPALDGAIESVRIDADGQVSCEVIGGVPPRGICGSGLVAALGELRRCGRMDELGRFRDGSQPFVLDPASGVSLSEADVSELAQAKAANVAGLRIVLRRCGVEVTALDRFYLAGGFGRHLDLSAARRIGLVPDLPEERIVQLGNATIEGATVALLSKPRRTALEALVKKVEHVELETDEQFFDSFVDGCQFRPLSATPEEAGS